MIIAGKCLFLSGLVPRPMNAENDRELLNFGIGFTNIVERTTRANQELSRQEIEEGEMKCTLDKIRARTRAGMKVDSG